MDNKTKGIFFIILSSFSFSIMNTLVKMVEGIPSIEKALFRNGIALIVAFIVIATVKDKKEGHYLPKKGNRTVLFFRGLFGTLGLVFLYMAMDRINMADATMLNKLSPFFLIIFSALFLKEKITPVQIGAILTAFVGATFVIKPTFSADTLPYIIGFLSGLFAGAAYTCVRWLGSHGERGSIVVFYFSLFSTVALTPIVILIFEPLTATQLTILILSGLAATAGQFSLTKAYSLAPPKEISIYDYSQMLFSSVWSFLIFNQLPDGYSILGYFIILSASLFLYFYNNKLSAKSA